MAQLSNASEELRLQFNGLRSDVAKLTVRMDRLEGGLYEQTMRINSLGEDMRQRFRVVSDRLASVEQRLAA